jgi:hypothetical protein
MLPIRISIGFIASIGFIGCIGCIGGMDDALVLSTCCICSCWELVKEGAKAVVLMLLP